MLCLILAKFGQKNFCLSLAWKRASFNETHPKCATQFLNCWNFNRLVSAQSVQSLAKQGDNTTKEQQWCCFKKAHNVICITFASWQPWLVFISSNGLEWACQDDGFSLARLLAWACDYVNVSWCKRWQDRTPWCLLVLALKALIGMHDEIATPLRYGSIYFLWLIWDAFAVQLCHASERNKADIEGFGELYTRL